MSPWPVLFVLFGVCAFGFYAARQPEAQRWNPIVFNGVVTR